MAKSPASMDLEEIDAEKLKVKEQIQGLQEKYNELNGYRIKLVELAHYEEAIKQLTRVAQASERSVDQVAAEWMNDGDRGHQIQATLYFENKKGE